MIRFATVALLALLTTACYAASDAPPATSAAAATTATTAAPKPEVKPLWPDNGIAQRRFEAGGNTTMFVEDDHGVRRAWVVSTFSKRIDGDHAWAKALDFFSGKVIKVKVGLTEDGHESQVFTAPDGTFHFASIDPRYPFSGTAMGLSLPGMDLNGGTINIDSTTVNGCAVNLDGTAPKKNWVTGQKPAALWMKYPIYHLDTGGLGCASGFLHSMIGAALDLGDGTFLASEGCFVFRLRKSDLSPVGAAPALRVVDASTIKAAIGKLHGKTVDDPTGYLIKALNLPTSPELSCQGD